MFENLLLFYEDWFIRLLNHSLYFGSTISLSPLRLSPEVEAEHVFESTVRVGQTELILAVAVGVEFEDES